MKSFTKTILLCFLLFGFIFPITATASGEGWLDGWDHRQGITIFGSSGAGIDYQVFVNVTYDSDMQADFDDLRFTDDDGATELDYWLEDYTASTFAIVWVEVSDNLDSRQTIWMYFGNDAVSTTSNGVNTFFFYEDWTSGTLNLTTWDVQESGGSVAFGGGANHGQLATFEGNDGANTYRLESDLHRADSFALRFRSNIEQTVAASQRTAQGLGTPIGVTEPTVIIWNNEGAEGCMYVDDDGNQDLNPTNGSLLDVQTVWEARKDSGTGWIYANDLFYDTGSCDPDTESSNVALIYVKDSEYQVISDWVLGRKFIASEPVITFSVWNELTPAIFVFNVAVDMWGFNTAFIILGLIMIPASTLYFVRGGRKEMSMDKIFYCLILFFVGIALVIGGVMP